MSRSQFVLTAHQCGVNLAVYAARAAGVSLTQCQLWALTLPRSITTNAVQ